MIAIISTFFLLLFLISEIYLWGLPDAQTGWAKLLILISTVVVNILYNQPFIKAIVQKKSPVINVLKYSFAIIPNLCLVGLLIVWIDHQLLTSVQGWIIALILFITALSNLCNVVRDMAKKKSL